MVAFDNLLLNEYVMLCYVMLLTGVWRGGGGTDTEIQGDCVTTVLKLIVVRL